jgi:hypothetical protein
LVDQIVLAVSAAESQPLSIAPAENKTWEALPNGKVQIPLKFARRLEGKAAMKLKPIGIFTQNPKEIDVPAGADTATFDLELAPYRLVPGTYSVAFMATTQVKYSRNPQAADEAQQAQKKAEQLIAELTPSLKKAGEAKQAAASKANESAAAAKKAGEALAQATKAADEARDSAAAAGQKLAAARSAAHEEDEDQGAPEIPSLEKVSSEAAHKATLATKAKASAEKTAAAAAEKARVEGEAKLAAEKAEAELAAKLKDAERQKQEAANRLKELAPRDTLAMCYSTPVTIKINAPPEKKTK